MRGGEKGASRLLFHDRPNVRKLDVFVDGFELDHSIPITARIDVERRTILTTGANSGIGLATARALPLTGPVPGPSMCTRYTKA